MPTVVIDGVRYVPQTDVPKPTDEKTLDAVGRLITCIYLYGAGDGTSSARACVWEALQAIAPNIYDLARQDRVAAFDAVKALRGEPLDD